MIKVLIVEDEGLFRDMLAASLCQQPNLQVVEAVGDGASAILAARRHQPNVVVTDIELGSEPHGIEAAHLIREESPQTGIVILSSHKDKEYIASVPVEKASGWSYLLKQSVGDVSALVRAIEGSADGFMVLDPAVVEGLRAQPGSPLSRLTRRQHEVVALMAQGYSNAAIAGLLVLGVRSVENYVNAVYQQLSFSKVENVHPRVQAVLTYLRYTTEPKRPRGPGRSYNKPPR